MPSNHGDRHNARGGFSKPFPIFAEAIFQFNLWTLMQQFNLWTQWFDHPGYSLGDFGSTYRSHESSSGESFKIT